MIGFRDDPDRGVREMAGVTHLGGTVTCGVRSNASTKSHVELDDAEELNKGDPRTLAAAQHELTDALPGVSIVGGCCASNARHVAALWNVD